MTETITDAQLRKLHATLGDLGVTGTAGRTDAELRSRFEQIGWSITPTLCPKHTQKETTHV